MPSINPRLHKEKGCRAQPGLLGLFGKQSIVKHAIDARRPTKGSPHPPCSAGSWHHRIPTLFCNNRLLLLLLLLPLQTHFQLLKTRLGLSPALCGKAQQIARQSNTHGAAKHGKWHGEACKSRQMARRSAANGAAKRGRWRGKARQSVANGAATRGKWRNAST